MNLRVGILAGLVATFAACAHEDPKPKRTTAPGLGLEIFGVLCERVGAQALSEDLSGASYRDICHGEALEVDTKELPKAADSGVRKRAVAKIEALAHHRTRLIAALDEVFPDDEVVGKNLDAENPAESCKPVKGVPRREQLRGLLTRLLPTESKTVPESSRSIARAIEPLMSLEGATPRKALPRLAARRGYMPPDLSAGLLGSVFGAPRLRDLLGATTQLLAPGGKGNDELQKLAVAAIADLEDAPKYMGPLTIAPDGKLSRGRTAGELVQALMLAEDPAFSNGPPLFVVRRDARGMAVVKKDSRGKVPAPFVDQDGDGLPDIDTLGRFVTKKPVPDPFTGDTRSDLYEYIDARSTAASAFLRHLTVLADPDGGDESVLAAVEGLEPLVRQKEALLDVVHAVAQVTADPSTDALLGLFADLFRDEPQLMARVTGNLLDAKELLDKHPEAVMPRELTDDLLPVLTKAAAVPGLLEAILASTGDPRTMYLKEAVPPLLKYRDLITYDPNNLNGPPRNLTTRKVEGPRTPVNRSAANTGDNRSLFQRFLQSVHDGDGVTVCNREGGSLHAAFPLDTGVYYPTIGAGCTCTGGDAYSEGDGRCKDDRWTCGTKECALLKLENVALFFLRSMVGEARIHIRDESATPYISMESMKLAMGLTAMWPSEPMEDIRPKPELLNRLVFFDVKNDSPRRGDKNASTNLTIRDLQGPNIPSSVCPLVEPLINDPLAEDGAPIPPDGSPDRKVHNIRRCKDGQYFGQRNANTMFALEYNHGFEALTPLVEIFVKFKSEQLLIDLMIALDKHWAERDSVVKAEPFLAELLSGDLVDSIVELAKVNAKRNGPKILGEGLRAILQPNAVSDRRGKQQSIFDLLRAALDAQEAVLAKDAKRQQEWLEARSHVVDEFFTIDGRGAKAKFKDPGVGQLAPVAIGILRAQREAKCRTNGCASIRVDMVNDVRESLESPLTAASLDMLDVVLANKSVRRELGRLTSYLTRQKTPLATAGAPSASSKPFVDGRGPGVLDQSTAAFVDALGALGDMREIQPLYPALADLLREIDPQLSLLKRLNARVYDEAGNELCSREMDPDGIISNVLARLSRPITVDGEPRRTALEIVLDAIADVNRVDASEAKPLDYEDYGNVLKNVHELLTDPESGLEQLYTSVRKATAK